MKTPKKTSRQYVQEFWGNPERALAELIREQVPYYVWRGKPSRREFSRVVEEESRKRYPDDPMPAVSVTFWVSWAYGKDGRLSRVPNLQNGIRLFHILIGLKTRHDSRGPE